MMCIWWSFLLASLVLVLADEGSGSLKKEAAVQSINVSDANNSSDHLSTFLIKSSRETKESGHAHTHVWPVRMEIIETAISISYTLPSRIPSCYIKWPGIFIFHRGSYVLS